MADQHVDLDLPEFHLVVRRPTRRGPHAPYRMALAVAFALFVAGPRLWAAAMTDTGYDEALAYAAGAGVFIWVLSGIVNRILGSARPAIHRADATSTGV